MSNIASAGVEIPTMFDESLWVKVTREPDCAVISIARAGDGEPQTATLSLEQASQLATTLTLLIHTAGSRVIAPMVFT